jgi:hypothetical protein
MAGRYRVDLTMRLSWAKWLLLGALILPVVEIVVFVAVAAQIGVANAFAI